MYGSIWKSLHICKNQSSAGPQHPAVYTHRHTTRESVSLIQWKCPNTEWCVDLLKGERRREGMMGKKGKMSSSIKSPYVYILSSIVPLGVRATQAQVWAGWPGRRAGTPGLAPSGLPLVGLPLLQGPFLLDTSADLLLKPAHLLLKLTDEIYHTLGGKERRWWWMKGSRRDESMRWEEKEDGVKVSCEEKRGESDMNIICKSSQCVGLSWKTITLQQKHLHTIMNCKMQKKNYNHLMKAFLSLDEQRSEH